MIIISNYYKNAGVNIDKGYEAVSIIKQYADKTKIPGVVGNIGGFGGIFDLSLLKVKEPVLVSGTDGVGTKLILAKEMNKHDTIGIDLVAMCVNDIIVSGAKPLLFLDYIATGEFNIDIIEDIVKGISLGCQKAECCLIGGESAEMPGMYKNSEYDLAGFTVGVVEKQNIINGKNIKKGNVLIGLASSGIHSNGYSLIRKILNDNSLILDKTYDKSNKSLGDILLEPTRIYVKPILSSINKININGMAHITGGGFIENIPRIMPKGLGAYIRKDSWKVPEIFRFLQTQGNINEKDMFNIFNMGIGMVIVLNKEEVEKATAILKEQGEIPYVIGYVEELEGVKFI